MTFYSYQFKQFKPVVALSLVGNWPRDGTNSICRTEDYPYYPNGGKHNKNYMVVDEEL